MPAAVHQRCWSLRLSHSPPNLPSPLSSSPNMTAAMVRGVGAASGTSWGRPHCSRSPQLKQAGTEEHRGARGAPYLPSYLQREPPASDCRGSWLQVLHSLPAILSVFQWGITERESNRHTTPAFLEEQTLPCARAAPPGLLLCPALSLPASSRKGNSGLLTLLSFCKNARGAKLRHSQLV